MRSGLFAISVVLGIVTTLAFHTISINYPSPFFENGNDVLSVSKSDSEINGLEFGHLPARFSISILIPQLALMSILVVKWRMISRYY